MRCFAIYITFAIEGRCALGAKSNRLTLELKVFMTNWKDIGDRLYNF